METTGEGAALVAYTQLREIYGHSRKVYALEFNCNGSLLASGSNDKTIRVWPTTPFYEGQEKEQPSELRGHIDSIHSLAWDPTNPHRLASTGADKTVRIWDAKTAKISGSISLQSEALNIVYSHDGKYIAVSNLDCVILIDARKNRVVRRVVNPYEVNEVQFSKSGYLFVAAGHPAGYGTFEIMKIVPDKKGNPNLENVHKAVAHAGSCFCLDFHPSGRYVAVGGVDSLVSLWDLEELYCVRTFVVTTSSIRTVRFNYDGSLLAIGMEDTTLVIVNTETGETALTLQLQNVLQYLCWHPTKNILAYVGDKPASQKNDGRDGVIKWIEIKEPSD
ncbi:hypothetical protein Poli38472_002052 [Pythium oligandrum]|uniref:THO complex subunit 3 n=1 Tax=Pythium oligandrum TaxID=41045 RepID=A0A8K1CGI7_PYTOL|nr:hypothetical protein Poli38472_002052 [Pythium oligandrum]|eukprot:TMW63111.1 hypothetical protein Poli38472_002052 [Pythium oligandrum]